MYDSSPRPAEGEPIEEVLPAAIGATATSKQVEKASQASDSGEPAMKVMYAGSPVLSIPKLSGGLLALVAVAVAVLVVLALVLI